MTTTKQYDYLNRLTQISSLPSASGLSPLAYSYTYNSANQRTKNTFADGSHWVYQYDSLGQVISGKRYWADGTPVAGQQYDYAFDTIGNRTQTQSGGDTNGLNLRVANYTVNSLNQYTARAVPGTNDVIGAALLGTNVTVNGQAADRKMEYFHGLAGTNNAARPAWLGVSVTGAGATLGGHIYVPQTPEQFEYDADGNLTNDGRWSYMWDAENRLIAMTVNTNVGPQYQLAFAYDSKGRRIEKVVTTNEVTFSTNTFLYDGWNLIAVLSQISTLQSTYVWGTDLSGSPQGAGGVGGLLTIGFHGTPTTNAFVAYDGNGDVANLVNVADGTLAASYGYGSFGEPIRLSGAMAKLNPLRFSSKYEDDESSLIYYGYRYYKPSVGTWVNRDPIDELGCDTLDSGESDAENEVEPGNEWNPYRFIKNDFISRVDNLGLWPTASPWYGRLINGGFALPTTHENSNQRVLPLSIAEIIIVDAASVFVDEDQGTAGSYRHAMRAPGQTKAAARAMANAWVAQNLKVAQQNWCSYGAVNTVVSLWYFGMALHTVQDSTSPAHHGFQVWYGLSGTINKIRAINHVAKEAWDPGAGSNLDKSTAWLWRFMKCPAPQLPSDFFKFNEDWSWWYD